MKEYIMHETEEMTTFGSVWKRYEPVAELIRCKDCKWRYPDGNCDYGNKDEEWFCADGKRRTD